MRKANYDKFPSTKLTGMLVQGWDSIISMLKEKMDARKVLAVDLYTGVYEEEVLGAFSKEFSGRVMRHSILSSGYPANREEGTCRMSRPAGGCCPKAALLHPACL